VCWWKFFCVAEAVFYSRFVFLYKFAICKASESRDGKSQLNYSKLNICACRPHRFSNGSTYVIMAIKSSKRAVIHWLAGSRGATFSCFKGLRHCRRMDALVIDVFPSKQQKASNDLCSLPKQIIPFV